MSLVKLPLEIVLLIFEYVGCEELRRSDLPAVSKSWYALAQPILYREVHISIPLLVHVPMILQESRIRLMAGYVKDLTIDLNMWCDFPRSEGMLDSWSNVLRYKLYAFRRIIRHCETLQNFTLRVTNGVPFKRPTNFDNVHAPWHDVLQDRPLWGLMANLPAEMLTSLTFETYGTINKYDDQPIHVCEIIADHLHSLRHLWIRMDMICPILLGGENDSTEFEPPSKSRLESLVINLRRRNADGRLADSNADYCHEYFHKYLMEYEDEKDLLDNMCHHVEVLASMPDYHWKVLRVTHEDLGASAMFNYIPEFDVLYSNDEEEWKKLEDFSQDEDDTSE